MARDHGMALTVSEGAGLLRLYEWRPATLSFGRNEPARGRYGAEALREMGLGVVRRPTGGRAVLHAEELTYAVVVPDRALGGARATYCAVHRGLAAGLRAIGVEAAVVPEDVGRAVPPDAGPCFQVAAPGEIAVRGAKLVGSAQARIGGALLQHGSILLRGDQRLPGDAPTGAPATSIEAVLGRVPTRRVLEDALVESLAAELGGRGWQEGALPAAATGAADELEERYGSEEWTWRR